MHSDMCYLDCRSSPGSNTVKLQVSVHGLRGLDNHEFIEKTVSTFLSWSLLLVLVAWSKDGQKLLSIIDDFLSARNIIFIILIERATGHAWQELDLDLD